MIANHIQLILIVTGAFTTIAFGQFFAPSQFLLLIYGQPKADAASVMLARHWGLLVGCVGLLLIYAAFEPTVRVHFMIFAVVSNLTMFLYPRARDRAARAALRIPAAPPISFLRIRVGGERW